ncbi:hypothetical protein FEMY_21190 [Ferrovum myxofaciens]|jgi:RNase P/RNase MRP subunit p29|uniref:Uncharacterized protein n=1 Tax=Ferrovum myxofaciens TaxID=416213 RepID=A0A149VVV2_9PROT|nr:hypothetical protein FEMY_21190 [Ferrovum myxofaciens]
MIFLGYQSLVRQSWLSWPSSVRVMLALNTRRHGIEMRIADEEDQVLVIDEQIIRVFQ